VGSGSVVVEYVSGGCANGGFDVIAVIEERRADADAASTTWRGGHAYGIAMHGLERGQ
jgi:hypothetical protein